MRYLLLACALTPAALGAQVIEGIVRDSTTRQAISGVTVTARSVRDRALLAAGLTDSSGRFQLTLSRFDTIEVSVRRIGFQPLATAPRVATAEKPLTFAFEMGRIAQLLDTVRTEGRRSLKGWLFRLTSGQEFYTRHLRAGKGFFTSSAEIRLSGLDPCDYFGGLVGLRVIPTAGESPQLQCFDGTSRDVPSRFVVPADRKVPCMEAFVDKKFRMIGMNEVDIRVVLPGSGIERWLPFDAIRGVEVYMNAADRPDDFSIPPMKTLGASRGTGSANPAAVPLLSSESRHCAIILLWTEQYWGH